MRATAHGHQQVVVTGEVDGLDDVSHPSGTGNQARSPIDIAVPHLAGLGIAVIAGSDELTAQALLECSDIGFLQDGIHPAEGGHLQVCHSSLLYVVRLRLTLRLT